MRYAIFFILLAGCATAEEKAAKEADEHRARAFAYHQKVDLQCRSYGFAQGSPDFQKCVMQVDLANQQQNEAQRQMLLQQYLLQQGVFRK